MAYKKEDKSKSKEKYKKLGLAGSLSAFGASSFIDQNQSKDNFFLNDYSLGLESRGNFIEKEPSLVVRSQEKGEIKNKKDLFFSYKTTRFQKEKEYIYCKYKFIHKFIGNLSFFSSPASVFSAIGNNFFNKFSIRSLFFKNSLPLVRLSFPKHSSNTRALNIKRGNQNPIKLTAYDNFTKPSKSENNKQYLSWNNQILNKNSKLFFDSFGIASTGINFEDYYIPYPNTVDLQQYNKFNLPIKIAAHGADTKIDGGLLAITTGDNNNQEIVYVSPHSIESGLANSVEKFKIIKETARFKKKNIKKTITIAVSNNNLGNPIPQFGIGGLYYESPLLNKFGKKTFVKNLNVTGSNAQPNYMIYWSGGEQGSGKIPQNVSGQWVISSGRLGFFTKSGISEMSQQAIEFNNNGGYLKFIKNEDLYSSGPILDTSKIPKNSINWHKISEPNVSGNLNFRISPTRSDSVIEKIPFSGYANMNAQFQVNALFLDSKNTNQGYLPSGISLVRTDNEPANILNKNFEVKTITGTNYSYKISESGHLMQETPLSETAFYKFYNRLYSNASKTIATGTWDGIIPSGTSFSIELISTKFNEKVGLNNDLYVIYSGYGNQDEIDLKMQKCINSKFASENLKKVKFEEDQNAVSYASYRASYQNTEQGEEQKARKTSAKKIQLYIYRILKKFIPGAIYINKKMKNFKKFESKKPPKNPSAQNPIFSKIPEEITAQKTVPESP